MKRSIEANPELVAFCGLYCGACGSYLRGRCPGCRKNEGATWCKVRACCLERGGGSCADCAEFPEPRDCARFHNWLSRLIGFVLRSDRAACVRLIREQGREEFARLMAASGRQSLPR